jgi:hypothetical protein
MRVKQYSKIKNLFHLHSWAPAYVDADNQEVNPGCVIAFSEQTQHILCYPGVSLGCKR